MASERLQKLLSRAGVASRRAAEKLIADGRVAVNGTTIREMGVKADPAADDIRVDGRRLRGPERHRYILLYKPAGYVTTRSDPQRRRTVLDLLGGVREYVYPVGRLDYDTEGLLLLTNDGDLAAQLTHPRHGVERTYQAQVAGIPDESALERLRRGVLLDGRRTLPARVVMAGATSTPPRGRVASDKGRAPAGTARHERRRDRRSGEATVLVTIREGRNRQVRRMLEAVGHPVRALKRTKLGSLSDRRLKPGEWRELSPAEVASLSAAIRAPHAAGPATGR